MAEKSTTEAAFSIVANHLNLDNFDQAEHLKNPLVYHLVGKLMKQQDQKKEMSKIFNCILAKFNEAMIQLEVEDEANWVDVVETYII